MPYKFNIRKTIGMNMIFTEENYKFSSLQDLIDKGIIVEVKDHWVPKSGETIFRIDLDTTEWNKPMRINTHAVYDEKLFENELNCFPNRELAEAASQEVKELLKQFHLKHDTANYKNN